MTPRDSLLTVGALPSKSFDFVICGGEHSAAVEETVQADHSTTTGGNAGCVLTSRVGVQLSRSRSPFD
jgi:hypothetical protein